jgi:hypothetical protein
MAKNVISRTFRNEKIQIPTNIIKFWNICQWKIRRKPLEKTGGQKKAAWKFSTVTIKITTPNGVVIFELSYNTLDAERPFGAARRVARHKRFAAGKTLAEGQFTCPEHLNFPRHP